MDGCTIVMLAELQGGMLIELTLVTRERSLVMFLFIYLFIYLFICSFIYFFYNISLLSGNRHNDFRMKHSGGFDFSHLHK